MKKIINAAQFKTAEAHLLVAAELLENSIENYKRVIVHTLAKKYAQYKRYIFWAGILVILLLWRRP